MSCGNATIDTIAEEQRPLLPHAQPQHYNVTSIFSQSGVEGNIGVVPVEPQNVSGRFRVLLMQAVVVVLLAVSIIVVLVNVIDADDVKFDFGGALKSALGSGLSGAAAMVLQVLTLMPLRTMMNYQYRYGMSTASAFNALNADGGYPRFYQGLPAALIQAPISRFGDMAANAGILALLESNPRTRQLPALVMTMFITMTAAGFRMVITPIDTIKTTLQTKGKGGIQLLRDRIGRYGISSLWYGALATAAASFGGHYPWFGIYNYLDTTLPLPTTPPQRLLRTAFIGFVASVISDTVSNSLRVLKTYRQVHEIPIGYVDAARAVIAVDGLQGLFGRGLKTKIWANGLQGLVFTMLWKMFMDIWNEKTD